MPADDGSGQVTFRERLRMAAMLIAVHFVIADSIVIDFVQWRIADPLQFRGISLLTQVRASNALCAVIQLHNLSGSWWVLAWQFLLFALWLARAVWPTEQTIRNLTPSDTEPSNNMLRFLPAAILVRIVFLMMGLFSLPLLYVWWRAPTLWMLLTLIAYLEACSPKPRLPKRKKVRQMVPVEA